MITRSDRRGSRGAGGRVSAPAGVGMYPQGFSLKRCDFWSHGVADAALVRPFPEGATGGQFMIATVRLGTRLAQPSSTFKEAIMLLSLLLSACTSDSTLGADMLSRMDDVRAEVADHREKVDAASTMDEVDQMESDHHEAMAALMDDMTGTMTSMMGCGMEDGMMGDMTDADDHMGQMSDEVTGHETTQAGHTDMADCMTEEDTYSEAMNEHMDAMGADVGGFDDSATCSGGGMGMM